MRARSDSSSSKAPLAWAAVLVGLAAWGVALGLNPRRAGDFHIYRLAAQRFLQGAGLYPLADGPMPFKYAPASAWLFAPALLLPARAAAAAWNALSVVALGWAARAWRRRLTEEGGAPPSPWLPVLVTLALAQSFFLELFYGQVDLVMLALLTWAMVSAQGKRDGRAGLALALAVALKPTAALGAVGLFKERRWAALGWAVLVGALLFVPVLGRYGIGGTQAQLAAWSATLQRTTAPWVLGHNPQGLPTLLLSLFYPGNAEPSARALSLASGVALAFLGALALLPRLRGARLWAFLAFGAAFASPLAWRANFLLAWPLLLVVLSSRAQAGRRLAWGWLLVVALAEVALSEACLGTARLQTLMLARPWGLVFLLGIPLSLWDGEPLACLPPEEG